MLSGPFLRWILAGCAIWFFHAAHAGRNEGINVSYECLGDDEYRVTVNLFRDCAEFSDTPDFIDVHISSSCDVLGYVELDHIYSQEVSQLCPESLPNSTCSGGDLPGVDLTVYSGVVELTPCADWKIIVAEQNRAIVTNLDDPGLNSRIHIETLLNNADGSCNTSPELGILNLPFICLDEPFYYNLGFDDPDGDSLVYALVPALSSGANGIPFEMNYNPGFSGSQPIDAITIDPSTGQINITPDLSGKYTVVVRVREYRDGVMVGEVYHDFNVFVNPCAVPPPGPVSGSLTHVSGGGYPLSDHIIGICPGDDFCFEIDFSSFDPTVDLALSSDLADIVPGATETVNGDNPATIRFCGTAPDDIAYQSFIITAIDDVCDIFGQAYYAIEFVERQPIDAGPDTVTCAGTPVQLTATNDTAYTWYHLQDDVPIAAPDISCNPCREPFVSPDTTTSYVVHGLHEESTCPVRDTVTVEVPLGLAVDIIPETCYENDGVIDIDVLSGSGDYQFVWDDIGVGPPHRDDLDEGLYTVTIHDLVYGCSKSRSFQIDHLIIPDADAGSANLSCGLSLDLEAVPSFGDRSWSSPDGVVFDDPGAFDATATAPGEGNFTLIWTENDGDGCVDSDTLSVSFYLAPHAQLSFADSICGTEVELEATADNGLHTWSTSPDLSLSSDGLSPVATSAGFGTRWAAILVVNGPCEATDTASVCFIEQPVADAGPDQAVCGDTVELQASPSVGLGSWILPDELTVTSIAPSGNPVVVADEYGLFTPVWTETNEGYCSSADTVSVRFTAQPEVRLPTDTSVCGDSLLLDAVSAADTLHWTVDPGYTAIPDGANGATVSGPFGATTVVVVADNGYGCTDADTSLVTFYPPPHIEIAAADTVCGSSTSLTALGSAEITAWTSTSLILDDTSAATITALAPDPGEYLVTLYGINPGGCIDTATVQITFFEGPNPEAGEDAEVCGLTFDAEATASVGDFTWLPTAGLTVHNPASVTTLVTADEYGSYPLVVEEANADCAVRDTVWVRFDPPPTILDPQWVCTGVDAEYVLDFVAGGGSSWTVSSVDGDFVDSLFTTVPLDSNDSITVVLANEGVCPADTLAGTRFCAVITDAGAMAVDTLHVCGSDTATALIATPPELDGNDSLRYALHDAGGATLGEVFAWSASPSFVTPDGVQWGQVYYISAVVGNYDVDGMDLDHNQLSVAPGQPVVFHAPAAISVDFSFTVCAGDTVHAPISVSGGLPQWLTYELADQIHTVQINAPGTHLTLSDSGSFVPLSTTGEYCEGEVSGYGEIHFRQTPHVSATLDEWVCQGSSADLIVEVDGDGPVSFDVWKDGDPYGSYSSENEVSLSVSESGTYAVGNVSDAYCSSPDSLALHLQVLPLPEVFAGVDEVICTGDTVYIGMPAQSEVTYTWMGEGVLEPGTAQTAFTAQNDGYYPQAYPLILEAESEHCAHSDTIVVTVYPKPELQLIAPDQVCTGETVGLVGYGADSYAWMPQGLFDDPLSAHPTTVVNSSAEIALIGWNAAGCADTVAHHIDALPRPDPSFSVSSSAGCAPLDVTIQVDHPFPGATYRWDTGLRTFDENGGLVFESYDEAGVYSVTLEATSAAGCTSESATPREVVVYDVDAAFSFEPAHPTVTDRTVFFTNDFQGADEWLWSIDSVWVSSDRHFRHEFPEVEGATYTVCLEAKGGEGCRDRWCRTIKVEGRPMIYVPNAFTPNGDGLNDLFYPELTFVDGGNYLFWVENRKGQVIFRTEDLDGKWNGVENQSGYLAPAGVYVWHIVVDTEDSAERRHFTGRVTVVR